MLRQKTDALYHFVSATAIGIRIYGGMLRNEPDFNKVVSKEFNRS